MRGARSPDLHAAPTATAVSAMATMFMALQQALLNGNSLS
jgi:hypothetical protein